MPNESLKKIISNLQKSISEGNITSETIYQTTETLSEIGYKYNDTLFPALSNTDNFIDIIGDSPSNLAEALLWKLGKWTSYKNFVDYYKNEDSKAKKTDVVFFAFAKHLKNKENPIYDQHAIRGLWAICSKFNPDEKNKCKSLLFDSDNKWKQVGSGKETLICYELFVKHINFISNSAKISKEDIDRLLMPLGQAIKQNTKTYKEFCLLCDWSQ